MIRCGDYYNCDKCGLYKIYEKLENGEEKYRSTIPIEFISLCDACLGCKNWEIEPANMSSVDVTIIKIKIFLHFTLRTILLELFIGVPLYAFVFSSKNDRAWLILVYFMLFCFILELIHYIVGVYKIITMELNIDASQKRLNAKIVKKVNINKRKGRK